MSTTTVHEVRHTPTDEGIKPPARRSMSIASPSRRVNTVLSNVTLSIIGIVFILPMAWLALSSIDAHAGLSTKIPSSFTLDNFRNVLTAEQTFRPLWNSVLLSFGASFLTLVMAVLAAYPLSRFQARFNKPFLYGVLFGTCLPITAIMVPVYGLFVSLNLVDSLLGATLFLTASSLPMAIWMAKNFTDAIPISLEEAAWIDGATSMQALRIIVLPLMKAGMTVVFIFTFVHCWGNFFVPFILLLSPEKQPAAVAIYRFFGQYGSVDYGPLTAFSILYSVPVIVLYALAQRLVGGGFAMGGAVKG